MAPTSRLQAILEDTYRPIATGQAEGETFVVYRSKSGQAYAFYRRAKGENVNYCATFLELLTVIRALAPAGVLAEMAPGIFLKAM